jgi:hypothetical protein
MNNETNNNTMKNLNLTKLEKQVLRNFIPTQNVNDFGEDVQKITLIRESYLCPTHSRGLLVVFVRKTSLTYQMMKVRDSIGFIYMIRFVRIKQN